MCVCFCCSSFKGSLSNLSYHNHDQRFGNGLTCHCSTCWPSHCCFTILGLFSLFIITPITFSFALFIWWIIQTVLLNFDFFYCCQLVKMTPGIFNVCHLSEVCLDYLSLSSSTEYSQGFWLSHEIMLMMYSTASIFFDAFMLLCWIICSKYLFPLLCTYIFADISRSCLQKTFFCHVGS